MTCIVGIVHEGKVYLGADSAGSTNDFIATRKEPKAFKINNFGFAYTSSFRMGDLLHSVSCRLYLMKRRKLLIDL
jgi:20S proteasome alpha/beta subunit